MRPVRIVIFAKAPVPGLAKTRLIPVLGAEGAARLAADMLAHTIGEARAAGLGEPELCATPPPDAPAWGPFLHAGVRLSDQGEGDLGERLSRTAARVLAAGERVLLVGSDCPALDAVRLRTAAGLLQTHDTVMHPAEDGGYVLLGLSRFDPTLFRDIAWSTAAVAAQTIARVHALGWSLHIGDTLRDVDEPADLN